MNSGTIGKNFGLSSGIVGSNEVKSSPGNTSFWGLTITNGSTGADAYSGMKFAYQATNVRFHVFLNSTNDRFHITDNGINNGVYLANNADSWTSGVSDERKKTDWSTFTGAIEKINTLKKVGTYKLIDPVSKEYVAEDETLVGLSAQEVQKIIPSAVEKQKPLAPDREDKDVEYLTLRYQDVFVLAVKAIQELSAENTELKTKLDALEARVTALEG